MGSIQRGGMVAKNDNGTLERIDGTNTYIGSATLPNGKVITQRFRGNVPDEKNLVERWLKWQGKKLDKEEEEPMANNTKKQTCPFSNNECGPSCPMFSPTNRACTIMLGGIGLYNIASNMMKIDPNESIELVAMAIGELKPEKAIVKPEPVATNALTVEDGIEAYLEDKSFLAFVNLHSKTVYSPYKRFCEDKGFPADTEANFSQVILKKYPELKGEKAHGGRTFVAA